MRLLSPINFLCPHEVIRVEIEHLSMAQYDDVSECGPIGAFVFVFSITSQLSFEFVLSQLQDMRSAADHTPVVVVANKTDLVRTRQVSEDGQCSVVALVVNWSTTVLRALCDLFGWVKV